MLCKISLSQYNTHSYLLYSAPLKRFKGFLQTLHSTKMNTLLWLLLVVVVSVVLLLQYESCPYLPETLGLGSASPLTDENRPVVELLSTPPRRGRRWLTETCSMNEVPYLRKYHHSNICDKKAFLKSYSDKMLQLVMPKQQLLISLDQC